MIQVIWAIVATLATVSTVVIFFIPAAMELRKPSDKGPRIINGFSEAQKTISISNIKEDAGSSGPTNRKCLGAFYALPSLED
jgi:hypothetical protein